jgi:hypothetical protein
MRKSIFSE